MYLTSTNLVHYLLACGYVTRAEIVHAPFSVFEIDGHHRSFRVAGGAEQGLFVKQLKTPDQHSVDFLLREASCYRLAWSDAQFVAWQRLMPRLIGYDQDRHIIIVQQIANTEELVRCHRRLGSFPLDLAYQLGSSLADLHTTTQVIPRSDGEIFPTRPPWVLRFLERGHESSSEAVRQLASVVSADGRLSQQLADLEAAWSSGVLIHGDLKWSNCLVSPWTDDNPRLHLVDWEMASWGDPLWDVAGGLTGYVVEAMLNGSQYGDRSASTLDDADFLALVQPPMQTLWQAYCQGSHGELAGVADDVLRCVRYLGARLLLAVIEYHQHSGELGDAFGGLLEASRALLCDPARFAAPLLGDPTT